MSEQHHHRFTRVLSRQSGPSTPGSPGGALPMLKVADTMRNNFVAMLGEFVGTFMFLFFAFAGTQIANTPAPEAGSPPSAPAIIFISLAFGVSLTANVWAFFRITGGLFNPCVTLALIFCGGLPVLRALFVIPAQLLGGMAAAGVVKALFPGPMPVDTLLGGGANTAQGLFIEMFLTAQLVFVILMLAVEKHRSTYLAPVGIGLTFFLCELVGVYFTGGSLNPARSLGPAVANRSFPGYFWIYWLGPIMGTFLASGFYLLLKSLRYQECNPGQDSDGYKEPISPLHDVEHKAPPHSP
ncbi:aquaporin-2 [Plectosphaerella plurivora]|uniref:Aquaporin-2 n=1 Tax=Plectosphaerella plurivora TaxID=936078 RepID=A0A9P8VAQ0_9PEZI|nr:aquaporin-2 [Plectosphaerella plurivora]